MSARTKARKRALDILYAADLRNENITEALGVETERALDEPERQASWEYAQNIVEGVVAHSVEIDEVIQTYSRGWTLERMPAVDRAILRIAVWEIMFNPEVPAVVAVNEAVESAKMFSTEESSNFVNGLLASIASTTT
jgi:N utilization substance protein B